MVLSFEDLLVWNLKTEEKQTSEFDHFEKWVFGVVCICCYLHLLFCLLVFVVLFVAICCLKKVCGNRETRRKTTLTLGEIKVVKAKF